jgi:hypothetical protein
LILLIISLSTHEYDLFVINSDDEKMVNQSTQITADQSTIGDEQFQKSIKKSRTFEPNVPNENEQHG